MRNLKFPMIFAGFGFALSLFFGFFSRSHFGIIFLRALIFAVVFFAIGFGIKIIYGKFLDDNSSSDFDNDQLTGTESAPSSSEYTKGQHVDFVVKDEELDSETSDNHYVVGQNHQMLSEADMHAGAVHSDGFSAGAGSFGAESSAAFGMGAGMASTNAGSAGQTAFSATESGAQSAVNATGSSGVANSAGEKSAQAGTANANSSLDNTNSGFVPLGKESFKKVSGTEAVISSNIQAANPRQESSSGPELDVLPDMSDLQINNDSSESSEEAESDDTDFEGSSGNYKSKNTSDTEVKDASLMAKAISSLLSAES
ncbi:MAG: hypothetical protein K6A43_06335 [Treponema sp.]|nr:hypothetical protein [Treponema sp.]